MPSFLVKSRVTHPIEISTVEALSREEAIGQVVQAAKDAGDEVEVMDVEEIPADAPVGGETGATGAATGLQAHASETRATRAQLNEMSKDELLTVAANEGAEVNHNWNKADIIEAIVKQRRHS